MEKTTRDSRSGFLLNGLTVSFLVLSACLGLPLNAADGDGAQTSGADAVPGQSAQQNEPMEEITVVGQKVIFSLRQQLNRAEDRAFDIFNRLNDDDSYDVHCRAEAKTGTRLRRRTCLPNFYHDATANEAAQFLSQISEYSNYAAVTPSAKLVFAHKYPIFKDKVKELAKTNPEFRGAMQDVFDLTEELNNNRDAYHGVGVK